MKTEIIPTSERTPDYNKNWPENKSKYEDALKKSQEIFTEQHKLTDAMVPEGKFILFVNSVVEGITGKPHFAEIHPDRQRLMNEAETGHLQPTEEFQSANMRYMLGFETDDTRFMSVNSFDKDALPAVDLRNCVGIVYSGSEINLLDEHNEEYLKATHRVKDMMQQAKNSNTPQLGICFGGQALAEVNGAHTTWSRNSKGSKERVFGAGKIGLNKQGTEAQWLQGMPNNFYAAENHSQEIPFESVQDGTVLALDDRGVPELIIFGNNMLATQFHPEAGSTRLDVGMSLEKPTESQDSFQHDLTVARKVIFSHFVELAGKYAQEPR